MSTRPDRKGKSVPEPSSSFTTTRRLGFASAAQRVQMRMAKATRKTHVNAKDRIRFAIDWCVHHMKFIFWNNCFPSCMTLFN